MEDLAWMVDFLPEICDTLASGPCERGADRPCLHARKTGHELAVELLLGERSWPVCCDRCSAWWLLTKALERIERMSVKVRQTAKPGVDTPN
jgi:hypothetical protein